MTSRVPIPAKCRHQGKLSMDNNPIVLARERYWLLEKRIRRLAPLAQKNHVVCNEQGVARAIYPNLDPRHKRASKLVSQMRGEQKQIRKFLIKSGAWNG